MFQSFLRQLWGTLTFIGISIVKITVSRATLVAFPGTFPGIPQKSNKGTYDRYDRISSIKEDLLSGNLRNRNHQSTFSGRPIDTYVLTSAPAFQHPKWPLLWPNPVHDIPESSCFLIALRQRPCSPHLFHRVTGIFDFLFRQDVKFTFLQMKIPINPNAVVMRLYVSVCCKWSSCNVKLVLVRERWDRQELFFIFVLMRTSHR